MSPELKGKVQHVPSVKVYYVTMVTRLDSTGKLRLILSKIEKVCKIDENYHFTT